MVSVVRRPHGCLHGNSDIKRYQFKTNWLHIRWFAAIGIVLRFIALAILSSAAVATGSALKLRSPDQIRAYPTQNSYATRIRKEIRASGSVGHIRNIWLPGALPVTVRWVVAIVSMVVFVFVGNRDPFLQTLPWAPCSKKAFNSAEPFQIGTNHPLILFKST